MVCAVVRRSQCHRDVALDELCTFLDERGLMEQKWPERSLFAKAELALLVSGGSQ